MRWLSMQWILPTVRVSSMKRANSDATNKVGLVVLYYAVPPKYQPDLQCRHLLHQTFGNLFITVQFTALQASWPSKPNTECSLNRLQFKPTTAQTAMH